MCVKHAASSGQVILLPAYALSAKPHLRSSKLVLLKGAMQCLLHETVPCARKIVFGKSVSKILSSILDVLMKNSDAVQVDAFLCEDCGCIALDEKPEKCPHCFSTAVQSV